MLTTQQVKHFRNYGYVPVENFFNNDEIRAMLHELERFKREGLGHNVATEGDGTTPSEVDVNYQIIPLKDKSHLFRSLPFHDLVLETVNQLIGDPVVRVLDQIFLKPGHSGTGTDWHQDNGYFQVADPTKGTAMWVAMHDATIANGTLHVVPNSHQMVLEHGRDPGSNHHLHTEVDDSLAVPIPLAAGGVVFFNFGIAHSTRRNNSDKERAGLAYHFLNTDYVPTPFPKFFPKDLVHLTGTDSTGGEKEFGVRVAGSWEDEVRKLVDAPSA